MSGNSALSERTVAIETITVLTMKLGIPVEKSKPSLLDSVLILDILIFLKNKL
jgi:hypothetical protein